MLLPMKRVIREVITLIRIERWLVKEDAAPGQTDGAEAELIIEETLIEAQDAERDDLHVIAQRVLEARQWEVIPQEPMRKKRSKHARQSPNKPE